MARKRDPNLWLEEYRCGCTFVGEWRERPGYCGTHGESKKKRGRAVLLGRASANPNMTRGLL